MQKKIFPEFHYLEANSTNVGVLALMSTGIVAESAVMEYHPLVEAS